MNIELPAEFLDAVAARVTELLTDHFEPAKQWPEWMALSTASLYLDCGEHRLRKLVQRGDIPHVRDGSRIFFERTELDSWMTSKRKENTK
jgi:excisionase family DNA binding protein